MNTDAQTPTLDGHQRNPWSAFDERAKGLSHDLVVVDNKNPDAQNASCGFAIESTKTSFAGIVTSLLSEG